MRTKHTRFLLVILLCMYCFVPCYALSVGNSIPSVTLPLLNNPNKTVSINHISATYLYLDFWASWCISCRVSLPKLSAIANELEKKGLKIVAINLDENRESAKRFLKQYPVSFLVLSDTKGRSAELFNLPKMPSAYLIKNGKIIKTFYGYSGNEISQLQRLVQ